MRPPNLSPVAAWNRLFGPYFRLPAGVWALSAAIFINRMGSFVVPFLTLYLTQKAGYTAVQTGFFITLLPVAIIPALLSGGWLADHWGRRRVLVAGQSLSGLVYVIAGLDPLGSGVPVLMIMATFLANLAQVGHHAMLNDLTVPDNRKAAFSLNYLCINLGFSVGPLLAGFLFSANLGLFFLIDGLTTWISALLVFFLTKETLGCSGAPELHDQARGERRVEGGVLRALAQRPFFLGFLAISFLSHAIYSQHTFGLPLQLTHDFGARGPEIYGILMAVNGLTVVLGSTILTRWTARFSSLSVVASGALFYALGFGLIGDLSHWAGPALSWFVASTVLWTLGEILASVAEHVYISSHTPANHRGRFNALRMIIHNLSTGVSTALAGLYIAGWGISTLWPLLAGLCLLVAACLVWLGWRERTAG